MTIHKLVMVISSYIKFCQSRKKGSVDVGSQRRVLGEKLQSYAWLCCLLARFHKPVYVKVNPAKYNFQQYGFHKSKVVT